MGAALKPTQICKDCMTPDPKDFDDPKAERCVACREEFVATVDEIEDEENNPGDEQE